ncbi:response regulator [Flavobacterium zepuense]|uniref:Response regulator n=1 Tax=Flavobacterium zepuense TaxID=2593302 RepID=A0A552UZR0_9FLAO|nr:response regulator [Flavobacterium zepuense]TRW23682.1 response regulator [Flavobacterium zepuense]
MMKRMYNHVLLADDDYDDCEFFEEAFTAAFPEVKLSISSDGGKLMEYLNSPPVPAADVIFLDLNMPVKTGPECLLEIRADEKLKKNVVVVFTTSNNPADIEKMYNLGANYFVTKPTDYEQLKKLIVTAIDRVCLSGNNRPEFKDFYIG